MHNVGWGYTEILPSEDYIFIYERSNKTKNVDGTLDPKSYVIGKLNKLNILKEIEFICVAMC